MSKSETRSKLFWMAALMFLAIPAFAANDTWNGGAGSPFNWSNAANWNNAPVAGDSLFFDGTTGLANVNDFSAGTGFSGITFNSTAGAFTLTGSSLVLTNGAGITNSSGTQETIALSVNPGAPTGTVQVASGQLMFAGTGGVTANGFSLINLGNVTGSGAQLTFSNTVVTMGANILTIGGSATATNATLLVATNAVLNNNAQRLQMVAGTGNLMVINAGTVTNVGEYAIGNGGSGSTFIVTNGGKFFAGAAGTFWEVGRVTPLNTMIVTGTNTLWDNGGKVFRVGSSGVANSNTVIVANGAVATNVNAMYVPDNAASIGEQLIITNNAKLYAASINIAQGGGSSTNLGFIANGAFISLSGGIGVSPNGGSANQFVLSNASMTMGGTMQVGGNSASVGNSIVIQPGALVTMTGSGSASRLNFGNGYGNNVVINGGVISNSASLVIGNGSTATNDMLIVTNGGKLYLSPASSDLYDIGRNAGAISNALVVVGNGSVFDVGTHTLTVGGTAGATLNSLMTVASGGVYTNGSLAVGGNGSGHVLVITNGTVYANNFTVNGSGSVYLNGGSADILSVDAFSGGSSSTFITGAVASASQLIVGYKNSSSTVTPILAGNIALTKTGTGTLTLGNANNNFYGNIIVNGGTLASSQTANGTDGSTSGFGAMSVSGRTITVTNGGTLAFTGNNVLNNGASLGTLPTIVLYSGSTNTSSRFNRIGNLTLNGGVLYQNSSDAAPYNGFQFYTNVTVAGSAASTIYSAGKPNDLNDASAGGTVFNVANTASGGADLTDTAGLADYFGSGTASAGSLTKIGNGTLALAGTNTYTGSTTVGAGKLILNSYSLQSGPVSVNDGATLDVTVAGLNQITNSTLTVGSSAGAVIEFVGLNSTTVAPVVANTLNANGTATINLVSPSLAAGNQYPLIVFTSTGGAGSFVIGGKPRGSVINLVTNNNGNGTFTLALNVTSVSSASTDVWTGNQNGNWDINTSTNWTISSSPNTYYDGDQVQFTDTSSVTNVTLSATVTPASTTVNSSKNYTFISSVGSHIAGAGGLNKSGTGILTLAGLVNTYTGTNTITGGKVSISADSNLGASTNKVILSGGALSASVSLTLSANRPLFLGAGTVDVATNQVLSFAGAVADDSPSVGSLTKTGPGTLNLTGTNTYTGSTTVSAGKLILTTAQQTGGAITVADSAALRVASAATGAQFPVSTLTLGSSGSSSVEFQGVSGTNALIVAGSLVANGTITVNLAGGSVALGEIPLVKYTSKSGSGTFVLGTLPPNLSGVITNDTANKLIALNVTNIGQLTWSGAVNSTWDIATTTNWLSGTNGSVYSDNSPLLFDNSGLSAVSISVPVKPGNITISNTTLNNYTFSVANGSAGINGTAGLTKLGSGTVTLNPVTNTYSGGTVIGGGQVILAAHTTSAPNMYEFGTGPVTITNNALLELNGVGGSGAINPQYFTNDFTLNGGGIFGLDGGQHFSGNMNIVNFGAVGEVWNNKCVYIDGPLNGSGTLTIPGSGVNASPAGYGPVFITSSGNSFNGTVTVNNGALGIQDTAGTALQNAIVNLTGFNGGIGGVTNGLGNYVSPILWTSNTSFTITIGGLAGTAPLNLDANLGVALIVGNNRSDTVVYSGVLGGGVASASDTVTKVGSGTQWLIGTNTYSSATYVNGGTLGISTLHAGNGDFTVQSSAGLSVTNIGVSHSAALASLTLGSSTLAFSGVSSTTVPMITSAGALTVNGPSTVVISVTNGLAAGNVYPLVSASSIGGGGSFSLTVPAGITANLVTNGSTLGLNVTAVAPPVNTTPTNLSLTITGNQLVLSWPADHTGWYLQVQTNSLSTGLGTNWVTLTNTASVNSYTNIVDPTKGTVFYRMVYP